MRRPKKILFFLAVLVLTGCFCVSVRAAGPAAVSSSHPVTGFPLGNHDRVTIYEDKALTQKKLRVSYRKFSILQISGDAVYVRCVVTGGKAEGWASRETFLAESYSEKIQTYAVSGLQLSRGWNTGAKFRYIPANTGGYTIGKKGSRYQVMFYLNKRYYLGWVTEKEYQKKLRQSMTTTEQPLADGVYLIENKKMSGKALTCSGGVLSLSKSTGAETQLFRLTYQKNGAYLITSYDGKYYLTADGRKVAAGTKKTYWRLSRSGAYFILEEKAFGNAMAATGSGSVKMAAYQAAGNYKWTLTKKTDSKTTGAVTVFSQYDPKWGNTVYCEGNSVRTIASSGCGVVAYVNAIYALNGQYIDPRFLANYSNSNGHYIYMSGTNETLYQAFAARYGSIYHFKWSGRTESMETLKNHLQKGGTAVANVPGHYIAIAGYRKSDNKYLVLDSAITGKRATTVNGDWVEESALQSGTLNCWYFHLFSAK